MAYFLCCALIVRLGLSVRNFKRLTELPTFESLEGYCFFKLVSLEHATRKTTARLVATQRKQQHWGKKQNNRAPTWASTDWKKVACLQRAASQLISVDLSVSLSLGVLVHCARPAPVCVLSSSGEQRREMFGSDKQHLPPGNCQSSIRLFFLSLSSRNTSSLLLPPPPVDSSQGQFQCEVLTKANVSSGAHRGSL